MGVLVQRTALLSVAEQPFSRINLIESELLTW